LLQVVAETGPSEEMPHAGKIFQRYSRKEEIPTQVPIKKHGLGG
jgi:hypothetical protein